MKHLLIFAGVGLIALHYYKNTPQMASNPTIDNSGTLTQTGLGLPMPMPGTGTPTGGYAPVGASPAAAPGPERTVNMGMPLNSKGLGTDSQITNPNTGVVISPDAIIHMGPAVERFHYGGSNYSLKDI